MYIDGRRVEVFEQRERRREFCKAGGKKYAWRERKKKKRSAEDRGR